MTLDTQGSKTPSEILATPIQFARGVGPQRGELLAKLELRTIRDLLFFFPRDYEDLSELREVSALQEGVASSVCGVIDDIELRNTGPGRTVLGILVRQGSDFLRCTWFNQPFHRDKFVVGQRVMVAGEPRRKVFRWEMMHPRVTVLAEGEHPPKGEILPRYSLTQGITQTQMRRVVQSVVKEYASVLEEVFPSEFLEQHQLLTIHQALQQIHAPLDHGQLDAARRRLIYQELLVMQLALTMRRMRLTQSRRAPSLPCDSRIDSRIRRLFPFELTNDQNNAIRDITVDLAREIPMNRLVQGDVGSGKTVVAEYAMLVCVAHGYQAVLMAPTEILARQHAMTIAKNLEQSRVRIALLVGSLPPIVRRETLGSIAAGQIDLVVGTHSILQDDVEFAKLGLVIIDEQHKFGVKQRAKLRQAGLDPHYLVMTATPIPRTISMTIFGDLDSSTLRTPPPGRQPVQTFLGDENLRDRWWDFYRKKLREGRQGYVITPLVEEREVTGTKGVEQAFETLANGELEAFRLGIVHGRQSPVEKDEAMQAFRRGDTQVLVATSVVEVGVDVPNATVMTIENAERFGLAQLHQLRGRICRGVHPGFACLFPTTDSSDALERLRAFCETSDGFEIAELDFRMRGPGDLFSSRQHGFPPLRFADVVRDAEVLDEARRDAKQMIDVDPDLQALEFEKLRRMVTARYGAALELGDVG